MSYPVLITSSRLGHGGVCSVIHEFKTLGDAEYAISEISQHGSVYYFTSCTRLYRREQQAPLTKEEEINFRKICGIDEVEDAA